MIHTELLQPQLKRVLWLLCGLRTSPSNSPKVLHELIQCAVCERAFGTFFQVIYWWPCIPVTPPVILQAKSCLALTCSWTGYTSPVTLGRPNPAYHQPVGKWVTSNINIIVYKLLKYFSKYFIQWNLYMSKVGIIIDCNFDYAVSQPPLIVGAALSVL